MAMDEDALLEALAGAEGVNFEEVMMEDEGDEGIWAEGEEIAASLARDAARGDHAGIGETMKSVYESVDNGDTLDLAKRFSRERGDTGEDDWKKLDGMEVLKYHVNVTSEGERETALHLACLYGHEMCAKLLIEAGSNVNMEDSDGITPLHNAAAGGFLPIVEMLLAVPEVSLTTKDADGDTALHAAARGDHAGVCEKLLAAGAAVVVRNTANKTPAELAEDQRVIDLLEASACRAG